MGRWVGELSWEGGGDRPGRENSSTTTAATSMYWVVIDEED